MPSAPFDTEFAESTYRDKKYAHPGEQWKDTASRVTNHVMEALPGTRTLVGSIHEGTTIEGIALHKERLYGLIEPRMFMPGGRYLYATGRPFHQTQNCLLLKAEDTREGWADLQHKATMALMTGAGIGAWYGDLRPGGAPIGKTGGTASGPVPLMKMVNETGRNVMQGGSRRSAIWAGLPWDHPDALDFIRSKDWPEWLREQKAKDYNTPAPLDMTNISITLNDAFFEAIGDPRNPDHTKAQTVYRKTVEKMVTTGEPGFSIDTGTRAREVLRNACTEITSEDDSDVCNLGSLVLPRFHDPAQFGAAVRDAVLFLIAGTCYSDLPYDKVAEVRDKNRRLGLGVMGVHEFLLRRGLRYGSDDGNEALEPYMQEYARALEYAVDWADALGLSQPIAATAIAPNGTIGIVAETTPSGDPLFSAARLRVVRNANHFEDDHTTHVVVDPVAKRLVADGVDASNVEDAYTVDYERRLDQQVFLQRYVDQAVSSTINLPYVMTDPVEQQDFGDALLKRLPHLRGIAAYPNGARAGQPLTPAPLDWALEREGTIIEGDAETCIGGACGV